jgi:hypothetical protein
MKAPGAVSSVGTMICHRLRHNAAPNAGISRSRAGELLSDIRSSDEIPAEGDATLIDALLPTDKLPKNGIRMSSSHSI